MALLHVVFQNRVRVFITLCLSVVVVCLLKSNLVRSLSSSQEDGESVEWLTPKKKINIQKAMDFSFEHINSRYQKDYGVSLETALEHERELKRFLIIAAENHPDPLDMFSPEIDNLWHTFLLFTKEYHAFCYNILGQFIHHVPKIKEEIYTCNR